LRSGWGRIINITGKSEPEHINGAFCAKAGIHSWAKGLSPHGGQARHHGELHSAGAHSLRTDLPQLHARVPRSGSARTRFPMGRYGEPGELADLVAFLASPLRRVHLGYAVIPVDGGLRKYQF
jgi:3-oxoacyl-[acyl-carrier protein] reductase